MIIDLEQFITEEKPHWQALEKVLDRLANDPQQILPVAEVRRLHYLYQRASADLARIRTFCAEENIRRYLESLVARGFAEIHETRAKPRRLRPLHWFFGSLPRAFRRHFKAFALACLLFGIGGVFGGAAIWLDPEAKPVLMPFAHLKGDPSERVAMEENAGKDRLEEQKSTFSSHLMTHNTKVSLFVMALGMTWGLGTALLLFTNGIMLGAVAMDYILAGETTFLLGWLMPHGVIEIPAILVAGQAGLMIGGALLGGRNAEPLRFRFRDIAADLITLIGAVAIMLVWAGIIEAFLSQYHAPVLPYSLKIGFGVVELTLLIVFLTYGGRGQTVATLTNWRLALWPKAGRPRKAG